MQFHNRIHFLSDQTKSQMMSFLIEMADGSIIVIDGGVQGDAEHLLGALRRITGQEKPYVDAWFLTHCHIDHIGALIELLEKNGEDFSIGKVYCSFPPLEVLRRHETRWYKECTLFQGILPKIAEIIETPQTGDRYCIGEAVFDVLYTVDETITQNVINNSSMVFRMTLGGQTVLFLGDMGIEAGRQLLSVYADKLHSDFVQMAHHGQEGVEKDVYKAIAPSACLWCTPKWLWDNDAGKGYNTHTWQTVIVRGWMEELGVKHHFVSKDGDHVIELPYCFE